MNRYVRLSLLAALLALATPATATAAPKLKATPSVEGERLVVTVTSKKAFTAKTRPRSISVQVGGATYKLKRRSGGARKTVWRSGKLSDAQVAALWTEKARIKVKTRAGKLSLKRTLPPAPAPPSGPDGGTPPPQGGGGPPAPSGPPGLTLTRDDAAGRQALAGGDLLLERTESGSTIMTYHRIFLYENGVFRYQKADWNMASGEICDSAARKEGTWAFKEAYTFPEGGGGTVVIVSVTANGQSGNDVLTFGNQEPNYVYVGNNPVRYDRNPNMRDQC